MSDLSLDFLTTLIFKFISFYLFITFEVKGIISLSFIYCFADYFYFESLLFLNEFSGILIIEL
jgi:hypothetical protein